jgi:hypothetical protein
MHKIFSKKIISTMLALVLMSALAYGYLLNLTVAAVVERRAIETKISDLSRELVALEARYLAVGNSITEELARSLSFVTISDPQYAAAGSDNLTFAEAPSGL